MPQHVPTNRTVYVCVCVRPFFPAFHRLLRGNEAPPERFVAVRKDAPAIAPVQKHQVLGLIGRLRRQQMCKLNRKGW